MAHARTSGDCSLLKHTFINSIAASHLYYLSRGQLRQSFTYIHAIHPGKTPNLLCCFAKELSRTETVQRLFTELRSFDFAPEMKVRTSR
jgi:hypothetical protein